MVSLVVDDEVAEVGGDGSWISCIAGILRAGILLVRSNGLDILSHGI